MRENKIVPDKVDALRIISAKEAARILGKHPNTLVRWRMRGFGPRFIKLGRNVSYRVSDINAWLENLTFNNTSEYTTPRLPRGRALGSRSTEMRI